MNLLHLEESKQIINLDKVANAWINNDGLFIRFVGSSIAVRVSGTKEECIKVWELLKNISAFKVSEE